MEFTDYFELFRNHPDRAITRDEWIERVIQFPEAEAVQEDGRIRRWGQVAEMGNRYLSNIVGTVRLLDLAQQRGLIKSAE